MAKAAAGLTTGVAVTAAGLTVGSAVLQTPATAAAAISCKAPSTSTNSTIPTVTSGSKGTAGQIAAACLRASGHSTGVGGTKAFQKSKGLSQTGKVDRATWAALLSRGSTPQLRSGSKGSTVTRLQGGLKALGYTTPVNGSFGATTKKAVQALQKKEGWSRTGIAGGGTWYVVQHGGHWKAPAKKASSSSASSSSKGAKALAYAKKQLGDPYRYGAAGPGSFDCSGLTMAAWKAAGVRLPHQTNAQYRAAKKISKSQLKPGDLVFFYSGRSHVAIYAGGGKVIHAPHSGSRVSYIAMKYMPFNGAVRPA